MNRDEDIPTSPYMTDFFDFLSRRVITVARTGRRTEQASSDDRDRNVKVNEVWLCYY